MMMTSSVLNGSYHHLRLEKEGRKEGNRKEGGLGSDRIGAWIDETIETSGRRSAVAIRSFYFRLSSYCFAYRICFNVELS